MIRVETSSAQETEAAGAALARRLQAGDVVLVAGELGSGKTTFVRGACRALGVDEPVTSPTFTIGQIYRAGASPPDRPAAEPSANDRRPAPLEVAHLDLYRLATLGGEDPALLADYLTPERVAFVEWPALAEAELERAGLPVRLRARVELAHAGADARAIEVVEAAEE